jgi:hypothetical protein
VNIAGINGATYQQPIGNGERFLEVRSAAVAGRDTIVNVSIR